MNWYRRLKFAQLRGEFWIVDSNTAMAADGDIGDQNHEGHVVETILSKYDLSYESDGVDIHSSEGLEQYTRDNYEDCIEALVKAGDWTEEQGEAALVGPKEYTPEGFTWIEEVISDITVSSILKGAGASDDEIEMVCYNGDARLFAMKHWGWKRLEGTRVETWTLTDVDKDTISGGLYDAYNEQIEDSTKISVFIGSTNTFLEMSYGELESTVEETANPMPQATQDAYQNAINEIDKPSNSYYKSWGD